ncbi:reverse transcriptase (RNA-dependent DNA polymerase) [Variovorax paradoxus]|uniref:Reverse transcriptase (RNA-dependent DNA polymerase) n=2 Tax=Variovorax paradoxus TaxID=34073 RepID=A0A0H2LQX4_VARPD|nr:reverse transcriptase (RNA-dependent DNA polymerase) [Variovorax paradoxus]
MANGVMQMRVEGTPRGGPLSPLLANVLLDEVDRELERKGHKFVRYADDCHVYVKSKRAGQRVLDGLRACYAKLRLNVNETKTAVALVWGRKFLGYSLWASLQGDVKRCWLFVGRIDFAWLIRSAAQPARSIPATAPSPAEREHPVPAAAAAS